MHCNSITYKSLINLHKYKLSESLNNTKVLQVLKQLNTIELNRLHKFIGSPYFNSNETILNYYNSIHDHLKKAHIDFDEYQLAQKAIGTKDFDKAKFTKLNNSLLSLVEEFFIQENLSSKQFVKANFLLEEIIEREIDVLYNNSLKSAKRIVDRTLEKSSSYYFEQYKLELLEFRKIGEFERKTKSKKELAGFNIEKTSRHIDEFFILEKIKLYCTLLSWKKVSKIDQKLNFIDLIEAYLTRNKKDLPPQIEIYYLISKTFTDSDNLDHYFTLSELIKDQISIFSITEAKEVYDAILNYCIQKINAGENSFQSELFERYKDALQNGVLLIKNVLSPTSFRNICFLGLRLKHFDYIEFFIKKYSENLPEKYRDNAVRFNLSRLYFYQNKFDDVLRLLSEVEYEDVVYNLNAKSLLLASYYELGEDDALSSLFESFRAYLRRNKGVNLQRKKLYINLINYTKKLTKLNRRDKDAIKKLRLKIEEADDINSKQWLLDKLDELME